jgi:hypothetical protein
VKADAALFETAGQMLNETGRLFLFRPSHDPSPDPSGFVRISTVQLTDAPQAFLCSYRTCVPRGTKALTSIRSSRILKAGRHPDWNRQVGHPTKHVANRSRRQPKGRRREDHDNHQPGRVIGPGQTACPAGRRGPAR